MSVVDTLVHPFPGPELAKFLKEPYRSRVLPGAGGRSLYRPPIDEYLPEWVPDPGTPVRVDPDRLTAFLGESGIGAAILVPLGYGLTADPRYEVELASGLNEWLAKTWLDSPVRNGVTLRGSIRVSARNPGAAVKAIEELSADPNFVQVAVPAESLAPYGEEAFFPIWEAASAHHLPVVICADQAGGVQMPPTPVGRPSRYFEIASLLPMSGAAHLGSLICQGVFERLPDLKVVIADGGFDLLTTMAWRLEKDWRSIRFEAPWVIRPPTEYLRRQVRFVMHRADGPQGLEKMARMLEIAHAGELLMYGGRFPRWDRLLVTEALERLSEGLREQVMTRTAAELYELEQPASRAEARS